MPRPAATSAAALSGAGRTALLDVDTPRERVFLSLRYAQLPMESGFFVRVVEESAVTDAVDKVSPAVVTITEYRPLERRWMPGVESCAELKRRSTVGTISRTFATARTSSSVTHVSGFSDSAWARNASTRSASPPRSAMRAMFGHCTGPPKVSMVA